MLTLSLLSSKSTFSQPFKRKCISEVARTGSTIIFHLGKLWKAKFSIPCDAIFLVRLQGKFDIDHSQEWEVWELIALEALLLSAARFRKYILWTGPWGRAACVLGAAPPGVCPSTTGWRWLGMDSPCTSPMLVNSSIQDRSWRFQFLPPPILEPSNAVPVVESIMEEWEEEWMERILIAPELRMHSQTNNRQLLSRNTFLSNHLLPLEIR